MNNDKFLVVVSGPSGTGKDTVVNRLMELHPEVEISVSATSRAMREGEEEGINYHYMTRDAFEQAIREDRILEHTQYCGNYYGTPRSEVDLRINHEITVVLVIEVEGAANIRRLYPGMLSVFLLPPSMEALEQRLRGRGTETEESIQKRLERAKEEMSLAGQYDRQVVNDDVDHCAEEIYRLIVKHQSRQDD